MDFQNQPQKEPPFHNLDDNNQRPQGNYHFIPDSGEKFALASLVFGIISIFCLVSIFLFFFAFFFGSLSIIFAILSKGKNTKVKGKALGGIITSTSAMVLTVTLVFGALYVYMNNKDYYNQLSEEIYGVSLEEMYEDPSGVSIDDLYKSLENSY